MSEYFFNLWAIPYFASCLISFILAWILFFKKQNNTRVQLFTLTQFFIFSLSIASAIASCSLNPGVWFFWFSIILVFSVFSVTTQFHFSSTYLVQGAIFKHKKLFSIYFFPFIFSLLLFTTPNLLFGEVVLNNHSAFGIYWPVETSLTGSFLILFYSYLGLMLSLTIFNFFRMFRQQEDVKMRRRSSYFILSSLVTLVSVTVATYFSVFQVFSNVEPALASLSISGLIIAYGILKDKLFDIDRVVTRSFKYTITMLFLFWIFLISQRLLNYIISETLSEVHIASLVSASVVAVSFRPTQDFVDKIADKLFPHLINTEKDRKRDLDIYRKQLELAWKGGNMTDEKRKLLKDLRSSLEISEKDNKKFEAEIVRRRNRDLDIYRKQLELAWKGGNMTDEKRKLLKDLRSSLDLLEQDHERLEAELKSQKKTSL